MASSVVLGLLSILILSTNAYRPLQPQGYRQLRIPQGVGEPLYLTPYIKAGDIETARNLSHVVLPLDGLSGVDQPDGYSGFLTVNDETDSNMFFWFVPATDVDPTEAPVVLWLQGGPGASSLFGFLEMHGPFNIVLDSNGNISPEVNKFAWTRTANVIYMDNPVGAGFSYAGLDDGLPTSQEDTENDLYEALIQWFTMFPEFQENDFYPFGESYAGKFVPRIAKKIHDENPTSSININLKGMGIGDGFMSPPDSSIYAEQMYQAAVADNVQRDKMLQMESLMKSYVENGKWLQAWSVWNLELGYILSQAGCDYYYDFTQCSYDYEEDDYELYLNLPGVRKAIHVGNRPFGIQSSDVYNSMLNDFMRSERQTVEFILERYRVLIYDGNLDIICNHSGILEMFNAMENWSGKEEFLSTKSEVYEVNRQSAGYLRSVRNLRMFVMRNAGHMVPRSQPENAFSVFDDFIHGHL